MPYQVQEGKGGSCVFSVEGNDVNPTESLQKF